MPGLTNLKVSSGFFTLGENKRDRSYFLWYISIVMIGQFTATYMKRGRWYLAFIQEIPGVNTQGRTLAEAKRNLKEALSLVLEANRAIA